MTPLGSLRDGISPMCALVTIIGSGPVGTALAARLTRAGVPVAAIYGRTPEQAAHAGLHAGVLGLCSEVPSVVKSAMVSILAVSDKKIGGVARDSLERGILTAHQVVLHTSGGWAARDVLATVANKVEALGTLHPLASLSEHAGGHTRLARATFAVEGDPQAVIMAQRLVEIMTGKSLLLEPAQMPLYHAAAVLSSNYIVALVSLASRVLEAAGVKTADVVPALVPLLRSTVDNLAAQGLPQALTGPMARGDVATVQRHLRALQAAVPDVAEFYGKLGSEVLALATQRKPGLDNETARQLRNLLSGASMDKS